MKRIYGSCLSLVLLVNPLLNPVVIYAHAGLGDDFGHDDAIANPSAIEIDQNTAQKVLNLPAYAFKLLNKRCNFLENALLLGFVLWIKRTHFRQC